MIIKEGRQRHNVYVVRADTYVDGAGAVFLEQRNLGRAARAARHPQDHRVTAGIAARLKDPVEVLLALARREILHRGLKHRGGLD